MRGYRRWARCGRRCRALPRRSIPGAKWRARPRARASGNAAVSIERAGPGRRRGVHFQRHGQPAGSGQRLTAPPLTAGDAPVGLGTLTFASAAAPTGGGGFSFSGSGASTAGRHRHHCGQQQPDRPARRHQRCQQRGQCRGHSQHRRQRRQCHPVPARCRRDHPGLHHQRCRGCCQSGPRPLCLYAGQPPDDARHRRRGCRAER